MKLQVDWGRERGIVQKSFFISVENEYEQIERAVKRKRSGVAGMNERGTLKMGKDKAAHEPETIRREMCADEACV
jgi:hypothetical protein